ncbi:MAG: tail fiber domain-containing protein [Bacteroidia bacterium]|nr:tail fiber domain-containing protein [Bacteroidia bacterium]
MKTKLLLTLLLSFSFYLLSSQVPQGFNYQAVARNSSGQAIASTTFQVKASILSDTLTPVVVWEELHSSVKTNASGVFGIVIGTGIKQSGSAATFSVIDWSKTPLYLKIQIYYQGAWKYMGSSKLWSVPYSMISGNGGSITGLQTEIDAIKTGGGLNTNGSYSSNTSANYISAATSLKNADDLLDSKVKTVESSTSALETGAGLNDNGSYTANTSADYISSATSLKNADDLLDSKIKTVETSTSGFNTDITNLKTEANAIETGAGLNDNGSYTANSSSNYIKIASNLKDADNKIDAQLKVNSDYIAANIVGSESKLVIKGVETSPDSALFRVKNKNGQTVFAVYNEGVRVYVDDGVAKGPKGGFAIGGFGTDKGTSQNFLTVTSDSVRVYVDQNPVKGPKGGFAIGGFGTAKAGSESFLQLTPKNYFIGHNSGKSITTGLYNLFLGYMSGYSTTEGSANTFLGDSTGFNNTEGSYNVFLGKNAGLSNETSVSNVFIGNGAGELAKHTATSSGSYNVAIGTLAGYNNNGRFNVFLGQESGYTNLKGKQNIFIGMGAGYYNDTASYNVAIGTDAGYNNMGKAGVFMGNFAGYDNLGNYNVLIGNNAGQATTTGEKNVILGSDAGYDNTTGTYNTFIGNLAGSSNISGGYNLYAGSEAGYASTAGEHNVYLGNIAGTSATGSYNTIVGNAAGKVITNNYNTIVGHMAGYATTTGKGNAFFGHESGHDNISGEYNTIIGPAAGYTNTTGSNNVFIGHWAGYYETGSDKLYIDNYGYSSTGALIYGDFYNEYLRFNAYVGINSAPSSIYRLYISGSAYATGVWTPSDIRLKQNVRSIDGDGVIDKVRDLAVIEYNYKKDVVKGEEPDDTKYIGVIAQDLEKAFPDAVRTDEKGYKAVNYGVLTAILVQAVKDQQKQIDELKKEVEELKNK